MPGFFDCDLMTLETGASSLDLQELGESRQGLETPRSCPACAVRLLSNAAEEATLQKSGMMGEGALRLRD